MALAMAVVVGWQLFIPYLYRTMGWAMPGTQTQQVATSQPAATGPTTQSLQVQAAPGATTAPAAASVQVVGAPSGQAQPATLGSAAERDPTFSLELALDPIGAGIKAVVLNDFRNADKDKGLYVFQEPYAGHVAQSRPLGTRWVEVNGRTVDLSNVAWRLVEDDNDPNAATYVVDLPPSLQVRKTYRVFPREGGQRPGAKGYEVYVEYGFRNLTGADVKVKTAFNGPNLPPSELTAGPDRQVIGGYRAAHGIEVYPHAVEYFEYEAPTKDLLKDDDGQPVAWAGAQSIYFQALLLPTQADGSPANYLAAVKAEGLGIKEETKPIDRLVATVFETAELTVPANGEVALPLNVYLGPRWRNVLKDPYYAAFPRAYNQTLVIAVGPCAMCTFDWLINLLVWMLGIFHWIFGGFVGKGDWGLAIIGLVILVRALLHPITKRSQISMMKMGKMGPQLEALRKKYGDDKEALSRAMWEFQKSQGITPILGCLPMFLQMPIWIALWSSLQTTFELRQSPFLWGYTWIDDLAKPDALISWEPINLFFGIQIGGLNILPILLAVVFFLQQKMQPKPPAMTPEQEQQQKMMQWMTLLFPIFLYGGPSGLNLYILTSTTIGIIESKRIRDHIKQREEAEKEGKVIIDAPPTRAAKRRRDDEDGPLGRPRGKEPPKPAPTGWLARKLAELTEKAEQIKREAERKAR